MSPYILVMLLIGLLLLTVSWASEWISRLPLSYALIYLLIGVAIGPYGLGLIQSEPSTELFKRYTEFVVIISLYSCGLKMNRRLKVSLWSSTIRLIGLLMPLSIFAVAGVGHWLLNMPWGAALLLGAILSPTDPVLASEVQLASKDDPNELRFGLTSEGGLNDALAFPFVYFGLYWIQNPVLDSWFRQWVAIDLIWAIATAVGLGILLAKGGIWVNHMIRSRRGLQNDMRDLVAIGLILLTYALTEVVNGYGFLAVFVMSVMLQQEGRYPCQRQSQLQFITQIEKLLEVGAILLLGVLLRVDQMIEYAPQAAVIVGLLLLVIRPVGAWISTIGDRLHSTTRLLFGWFGIRGIGSLYYLTYAISNGLPDDIAAQIRWITYITVITSIVVHGITTAPLITWHDRHIGDSRLASD